MLSITAVLGLSVASVAMVAQPASAAATGCAWWGVRTIGGVNIPSGQYCFGVGGSGLNITHTSGSFNSVKVGYPAEKVTFQDTYGRTYATYYTYSKAGDVWGYRYWTTGIKGTAKVGSVCGELMSYGTTIAKKCHNIRP